LIEIRIGGDLYQQLSLDAGQPSESADVEVNERLNGILKN